MDRNRIKDKLADLNLELSLLKLKVGREISNVVVERKKKEHQKKEKMLGKTPARPIE